MANTITPQTIVDGEKALTIKLQITADTTAEYSDEQVVDVSAFNSDDMKIMEIEAILDGFSVTLAWDATANVDILTLTQQSQHLNFRKFGGLINNAGSGKTGDILLSTSGLGAGDSGTIILSLAKRGIQN